MGFSFRLELQQPELRRTPSFIQAVSLLSEPEQSLGVNVSALREYVGKNTAIGWQKRQERRRRAHADP